MSNRRQFLRTLVGAIVAAPVLGKVLADLPEHRINPAWKTAKQEVHFAFNPAHYVGELEWHYRYQLDSNPLRYNTVYHAK